MTPIVSIESCDIPKDEETKEQNTKEENKEEKTKTKETSNEETSKNKIVIPEYDENTKEHQTPVNVKRLVDVNLELTYSSLYYKKFLTISLQDVKNTEPVYKNEVTVFVQETKDEENNTCHSEEAQQHDQILSEDNIVHKVIEIKPNQLELNETSVTNENNLPRESNLEDEKTEVNDINMEDTLRLENDILNNHKETNNNIVQEIANLEDPTHLLKEIQKLKQEVQTLTFEENEFDDISEMKDFNMTLQSLETNKRRSWQKKENKVML